MEDPDKKPMKRSKEDIKRRMDCETLKDFDIVSAVVTMLDSYVMQNFIQKNLP